MLYLPFSNSLLRSKLTHPLVKALNWDPWKAISLGNNIPDYRDASPLLVSNRLT
jgi:hypothetical protein